MALRHLVATIVTFPIAQLAFAADAADPGLMQEIRQIRAIDNHNHDDPADATRGQSWRIDLPLGTSPYPDVVPLRHDNPDWIRAWRALYGYKHSDMSAAHLSELLEVKKKEMKRQGSHWPAKVLDLAGVDVALVNAAHLGAGQSSPRFRWVPFADPLLAPFSGKQSVLAFPGGPSSLADLLHEGGIAAIPGDVDGYLTQVVDTTLARWVAAGAPAVKFLSAYRRSLDFRLVSHETAAPIYARGAARESLSASEQKELEDYLFVEISTRAGTHNLVVQIHTGNGNGPYFNNNGANPGLLENAIDSEPLQKTKFVLLHGGWPFYLVAQAMMDKPNTYADFSAATFFLTTHALANLLRSWLGWHPEKVLFGSDAYSDENSPLNDYEEKQWLLTDKSRQALAIALDAMVSDGEISRGRAIEIARMVLHDNAAKLYGIK
jgi:hypothetical protein